MNAEVSKNGHAPQALTTNAPWTDEAGIGVKIYQILIVTINFLVMYLKMWRSYIRAIYHLFVPPEPKSIKGEIILVTGTGHGMGREMALRFARLGGVIVCVDINAKTNEETVEMIKEEKGKAHRYECDVTNRESVFALADQIRREVGEVTMLVNNAGIMPCKPLNQHTEKEIRTVMDVNVLAHLWLMQTFLPSMMEKNHGHVVAMSSMAGVVGLRNLVPYCASKFAVRGLMEAIHEELREDARDFSGIKFTVICPFIVDTGLCKKPRIKYPFLMKIIPAPEAADIIVDAVRRNYYEITIPGSLFYINQICRALPRDLSLHMKDFLDSGLDPHDSQFNLGTHNLTATRLPSKILESVKPGFHCEQSGPIKDYVQRVRANGILEFPSKKRRAERLIAHFPFSSLLFTFPFCSEIQHAQLFVSGNVNLFHLKGTCSTQPFPAH